MVRVGSDGLMDEECRHVRTSAIGMKQFAAFPHLEASNSPTGW